MSDRDIGAAVGAALAVVWIVGMGFAWGFGMNRICERETGADVCEITIEPTPITE